MDPEMYKEIVDYKLNKCYPKGITKADKYIIRRRALKFEIKEGVLYRTVTNKDGIVKYTKVVTSVKEADDIFRDIHCSPHGAHCGMIKTREAICLRYYWPGMTVDIDKWVLECQECQKEGTEIKAKPDHQPIKVTEPWELLGMDLIGKLTRTPHGNQYICTIIDYFTKWAFAFPLKNKSSPEVVQCITKLFYLFGAPKRILTDQGKEFCNKLNKEISQLLQIRRSYTSAYHPQTNGLVEKLNGTIQRSLRKLVQEKPDTWDMYLDAVVFGINTKKQITTKYSPFFMLFGREARYPSEIPEDLPVTHEMVEGAVANEDISEGLCLREKIAEIVQKNIMESNKNIKKRNEGFKSKNYQVGDTVLKKNVKSLQRKGGKIDSKFLGPFTIVGLEGKVALIEDEKKNTEMVNIDNLKSLRKPTGRVPYMTQENPKITKDLKTSAQSPGESESGCSEKSERLSDSTIKEDLTDKVILKEDFKAQEKEHSPHAQVTLEIWQNITGHILMSKIGPYSIFDTDILCLKPGNELESQIINAYIWLLVETFNKRSTKKACQIDTYAISSIWQGKLPALRKIIVSNFDILIGAVHESHHWTLLAIYPLAKKAIYLNPLGENTEDILKCQNVTRMFLRRKGENVSRIQCQALSHPNQKDGVSCGVFVCKKIWTVCAESAQWKIQMRKTKQMNNGLHVTYVHIGFTLFASRAHKGQKIQKVPHSCVIVVRRKFNLCISC